MSTSCGTVNCSCPSMNPTSFWRCSAPLGCLAPVAAGSVLRTGCAAAGPTPTSAAAKSAPVVASSCRRLGKKPAVSGAPISVCMTKLHQARASNAPARRRSTHDKFAVVTPTRSAEPGSAVATGLTGPRQTGAMAPMTDLANLAALEAAAALVHSVVLPTPQYRWPLLSRRVGAEIWVKHENHTPTGAFKVRGGVVYLDDLRRSRPDITGVIAATTGNHGQSIAYSAAALGLAATTGVPDATNPGENRVRRGFGTPLVETGHDYQAAYETSV